MPSNRPYGKHEEGPRTAGKATETQVAEIEEKEAQLQKETQRHKRQMNPEREKKDNNTFHNDEAFERFEMGGQKGHMEGLEKSKVTGAYDSVKHNHHARGGAKEKKLETVRASQPGFEEDFDSLESINRK